VLEGLRRRIAPLLLVGAGLGAYTMVAPKLPHEHEVVLDLGAAASDITGIELAWTNPRAPSDEAALTTRWNFAKGAAPGRLRAHVRLADGEWEAEVAVERAGATETTRWSSRVNLEATPWWKSDNVSENPVALPVREALR